MKIKSTFKYSLSIGVSALIPMVIVFVGIMLAGIIVSLFTQETLYFGSFDGTLVGFAISMGIVMYKAGFEMSIQNGVSRRTAFIGRLGAVITYSIMMSITYGLFFIFGNIVSIGFKNLHFTDVYKSLYPVFTEKTNTITAFLSELIFYSFAIFTVIAIVMFITNAYCIMNKTTKLIVSIGVPMFVFTILPTILYLAANINFYISLGEAMAKSFGVTAQNPFYAILTCTIISVILLFFSYIMSRKAALK